MLDEVNRFLVVVSTQYEVDADLRERAEHLARVLEAVSTGELALHRIVMHDDDARGLSVSPTDLRRHAIDLVRDIRSTVAVDVDATDPPTRLGHSVRGLSADPEPGADDDDAATIQPQEARIVGNRRVVRTSHRHRILAESRRPTRSLPRLDVPRTEAFGHAQLSRRTTNVPRMGIRALPIG